MPVPNMKRTMRGWTERLSVKKITQSIVNFQKVETVDESVITGNLQPMKPETIDRKPEEQRGWIWWSLIQTGGAQLDLDEKAEIDGTPFRVEAKTNWSRSGFIKYELVEDWTGRAEVEEST